MRISGRAELGGPEGHGTVAAKVWGSPDGIPVMGLHGWMDNSATFDGIAPLLTPSVRWILFLICLRIVAYEGNNAFHPRMY